MGRRLKAAMVQNRSLGAPRVAFVTLGCAKNEVDTDRMKALLASASYRLVDDLDQADVAVVNTCSFLVSAVEECIEIIFEVLANRGFASRGGKLVVAGCMPSRYGEALSEELAEASAFVPVAEEDRIIEILDRLTGFDGEHVAGAAMRLFAGPSAYVKISDGCNRRCSFCTIPSIRGRYRSRFAEDIAGEVSALVDEGMREAVLIGQDTGVWGCDLAGTDDPRDIAGLLEMLSNRFPRLWLRVLYLQPEGINESLLKVVASHPGICRYFDIPVQHASDRVLRDMNRAGDPLKLLDLVDLIRDRVPGAYLRTTVMAGFPGETDEEFEELCAFLGQARFDYTGVFSYSQEEGTVAGDRPDQVDPEVIAKRAERLRDIADRIGFEQAAAHVGETMEVLVEGPDEDGGPGSLIGRSKGQAPEVDGQVHITATAASAGLAPGDIVPVLIDDSYCYELEGEVVV